MVLEWGNSGSSDKVLHYPLVKSRASGSIVPAYKVTTPESFIFNAASN